MYDCKRHARLPNPAGVPGHRLIPVPARVVAACALALWGAQTINGPALTVALLAMSALWLGWAAIGSAPRRKP